MTLTFYSHTINNPEGTYKVDYTWNSGEMWKQHVQFLGAIDDDPDVEEIVDDNQLEDVDRGVMAWWDPDDQDQFLTFQALPEEVQEKIKPPVQLLSEKPNWFEEMSRRIEEGKKNYQ